MTGNKRFTLCAVSPNVAQIKDKGEIIMIGEVVDLLNDLSEEKEQLKQQLDEYIFAHRTEMAHHRVVEKELKEKNQQYKTLLQDIGLLMSDEDVMCIRDEIVEKFIKPIFKENGFDVDVDCTNGFAIIQKGDDCND